MSRAFALLILMSIWLSSAASAGELDAAANDKSKKATEYLTQVAKILRQNYFPPPGTEMSLATVSFVVNCNGTTGSIVVKKAPLYKGHRMWLADKAVTLAVKNATQIPKPAAVFPCPTPLEVVFDGKDLSRAFTCKVQSKDCKYTSEVVGYSDK